MLKLLPRKVGKADYLLLSLVRCEDLKSSATVVQQNVLHGTSSFKKITYLTEANTPLKVGGSSKKVKKMITKAAEIFLRRQHGLLLIQLIIKEPFKKSSEAELFHWTRTV